MATFGLSKNSLGSKEYMDIVKSFDLLVTEGEYNITSRISSRN